MTPCDCAPDHPRRRIVLTGGPGAGKTAVLEVVRRAFCEHVRVLPESASILFGGGFPRNGHDSWKRAAQRAIYYVQRELERGATEERACVVLCDRGTLDGMAYWPPGGGELLSDVGTTHEAELARYDAVIHLRVPGADGGYNQTNVLRVETPVEARAIDARIAEVWKDHPNRFFVESRADFMAKAREAIALIKAQLPPCCQHKVTL